MASRCLLNALESRSAVLSKDYININRRNISNLSSNKSSKCMEQTYYWTDKQYEQWVERKFGRLDQSTQTKKKSQRESDGKQLSRDSN